MRLEWTPALNIGHEKIDEQHASLFRYFDEFLVGCSQGAAKDNLVFLHTRLKTYVEKHFHEEEALMKSTGYPNFDYHQKAHLSFRKRLTELRQQIEDDGPTLIAIVETNKILVSWLVSHVQREDLKFGDFLRENDVTFCKQKFL